MRVRDIRSNRSGRRRRFEGAEGFAFDSYGGSGHRWIAQVLAALLYAPALNFQFGLAEGLYLRDFSCSSLQARCPTVAASIANSVWKSSPAGSSLKEDGELVVLPVPAVDDREQRADLRIIG